MAANFQLFVAVLLITLVLLNINRDFGLYTYVYMYE